MLQVPAAQSARSGPYNNHNAPNCASKHPVAYIITACEIAVLCKTKAHRFHVITYVQRLLLYAFLTSPQHAEHQLTTRMLPRSQESYKSTTSPKDGSTYSSFQESWSFILIPARCTLKRKTTSDPISQEHLLRKTECLSLCRICYLVPQWVTPDYS